MKLENLKIGLGITGSFCSFSRVESIIEELYNEGATTVIPIISNIVKTEKNRFYETDKFIDMLKQKSGNEIIDTIAKAEPIGPKKMLDVLVICPCTGNTAAKLAHSVIDTPVLMAAKSHLRIDRPVVIGISTNDGLGGSIKNIAELLNRKNIYFIPFNQDDHINKPKSLVLDYSKISDTVYSAMKSEQIQPIIYEK